MSSWSRRCRADCTTISRSWIAWGVPRFSRRAATSRSATDSRMAASRSYASSIYACSAVSSGCAATPTFRPSPACAQVRRERDSLAVPGVGAVFASASALLSSGGPVQRPVPAGVPAPAGGRHAGVVHAPGRALAARIPGPARAARNVRDHGQRRAHRRGHDAAGATPRRRRRHLVLRHRAARSRPSASTSRSSRASARCSPIRSGRRRPRAPAAARARRPTCPRCSRRSGSSRPSWPCRSSASPARRSPSRPTSSRAGRRATTPRPRRSCEPSPRCLLPCSTGWPTSPSRRCAPRSGPARAAIQLFDSWAGALAPDDYRGRVQAGQHAHLRRARRTSACRESTSASAPASCWPTWPRPGPTSSASTGACRSTRRGAASVTTYALQGNLDPALVHGAVARRRGRRTATCCKDSRRPSRPRVQPGPRRAARNRPRHPRAASSNSSTVANPRGVLLMAYGTPATPADVEAYYTHVRRGRPPHLSSSADLIRRYDAIGGTSPLLARTRAQADGAPGRVG